MATEHEALGLHLARRPDDGGLVERHEGRPSYSWPPSSIHTSPRTSRPRSSGQSQKGGSEALAGMPIRSAATG